MSALKAFTIIAVGSLFLSACTLFTQNSNQSSGGINQEQKITKIAEGEQAPDFTLEDFAGNQVSLSSLKGKAVFLDFWAAWCPFCKQELIDFSEVQKELGDLVTIIAIDRAESLKTAKGFTDESSKEQYPWHSYQVFGPGLSDAGHHVF